jgi:hypothetical protein
MDYVSFEGRLIDDAGIASQDALTLQRMVAKS